MSSATIFNVLHIGNILNNGYLNCKFLRREGVQASCLNVDYRHVQGQPEWEEVRIETPIDHFNPDWSKVDLKGFVRPDWFYDVRSGDLIDLPSKISHSAGKRNFDKGAVEQAGILKFVRCFLPFKKSSRHIVRSDLCRHLLDEYRLFYPDMKPLTAEDISECLPRAENYSPVLDLFDLVQAYSLDPINVLLGSPGKPFICFEHGTMRDFPFEDSPRGRLYSLSLKKAEKVLITNADCNRSAERLGLDNYDFIPHPVDEALYKSAFSPIRKQLLERYGCSHIIVAPARHHWKNCPSGMENSWLKRNDIMIRGFAKFVSSHPSLNPLLVLFEWGQEVELSKKLVLECGLADKVHWSSICSKPVMVDYYNAADLVMDQFNDGIGTFGTVVPEALSCAKPVILNYKPELHEWCYPELPPLLNAREEEQIEKQMALVLGDDHFRLSLGESGHRWFDKWHSSRRVADKMIGVYREIVEKTIAHKKGGCQC